MRENDITFTEQFLVGARLEVGWSRRFLPNAGHVGLARPAPYHSMTKNLADELASSLGLGLIEDIGRTSLFNYVSIRHQNHFAG